MSKERQRRTRRLRRLIRGRRLLGSIAGIAGCLLWGGLLAVNAWRSWRQDPQLLPVVLLALIGLWLVVAPLCGISLGMRSRRNRLPVWVLCLCCAVLAGCERSDPEPSPSYRTLIVYLAADNDLDGELPARMEALADGWRPGMEVLVYADTGEGASLCRLEGRPKGVELCTLESYGVENSASAETLGRVLRTVWERYPASGYGLLFFSHASGWLPQGTLEDPGAASRSVGRDEGAAGAEIGLADFAVAIPRGMPLDYVVFEACLMAGAEVALELAGHTDFLLASSAKLLRPGFLPLYKEGLSVLASNNAPAEEALAAFGQRYMNYVRTRYTGAYRSATLSVLRTGAMPALAAAVREASGGRAGQTADGALLAGLQRFDRPGFYGDTPAAARFFDLEEYMERLATDAGALAGFRQALAAAVPWADATERFMSGDGSLYNGFDIRRHCGLTVYVPRAEFPALNASYTTTAWWQALNGGG